MFSASLELILNVAYREAASRRHTHLTLEHLLYALAHDPEGERILSACGADLPSLRRVLDEFLGTLETFGKTERAREPAQTLGFRRVLQTAVLHVQSAGKDEVRSGDVLAAILQQSKAYAAQLLETQGITRLDILNYISHGISKVPLITGDSESRPDGADSGVGNEGPATAADPLSAYAMNLTEKAQQNLLDPLIGRVGELRRTMEILCRRRKNNPVFVGDAGVGKTALAEGLAIKLLDENVPARLKGAEVFSLDAAALLAGTRFRGDFEERFKGVITALSSHPMPILFIDEVHATVGAGATTGGTMDLATLIKPILTAGELRVIGSTTFEEFKHIEKDRGLARRLQKVVVEEPSVEETTKILEGLRQRYESHHNVTYGDEALGTAAKLAGRHLRDSRLPDSAIDVIDEAGAVLALRHPDEDEDPQPPVVTTTAIERVVARMARIPEKQASSSDKERLRTLEESLQRVVFGQSEAVAAVAASIKRARAGLGLPDKPAGSFLFTGPTGVGKTELAKQLAVHLGNEFIRYDMSEYMEKHAVARLIGAPPGYVGFEQGGLLVDAVRSHPYSVVLLDEIEKAHPDVYNILLQVMDHATLTDNSGRKADFRHVVLIMTSNAGSREASANAIGFTEDHQSSSEGRMKSAIQRVFSPEFRNRLDSIVTFGRLTPSVMEMIVEKFILQLEAQLAEQRVAITLEPEARAWLATKGYDPVHGARPLARVVQTEVRNPLTDEILFGRLEQGGNVLIRLSDDGEGLAFAYEPTDAAKSAAKIRGRPPQPIPSRKLLVSEKSAKPDESTEGLEKDDYGAAGAVGDEHDAGATDDEPGVRVIDRRWWARSDDSDDGQTGRSDKPSYIEDLERRLADKDQLLKDYAAKYKTAASEFDETRVRLRKEVAKDVDREKRTVLVSFLEIADNLDRAIEASREASADNPGALSVLKGVEMVRQQFLTTLHAYGVAPIAAAGQTFDPNQHDAVSTVPVTDVAQEDVVIDVVKPGYSINDDVLRPAAVTVGKLDRESD